MSNPYDVLVTMVGRAIPAIVNRIPEPPAAALGRHHLTDRPIWSPAPGESRLIAAVRSLEPGVVQRLTGALELTVDQLDLTAPPGLTEHLEQPQGGTVVIVGFAGGGTPETNRPLETVDQFHPGATELIADLVERLAGHHDIRSLLDESAAATDEAGIAARHGAVHLALAVLTATAVLRRLDPGDSWPGATIVGAGLGAAALLLEQSPMPTAYQAAQLDKRRADYLLPRMSASPAVVMNHMFALADRPLPGQVDFSSTGLVAAVEGGVAIRAGIAEGQVSTRLHVLAEPPGEVDSTGWDEVVELSWIAGTAGAELSGTGLSPYPTKPETPPWPGDYRLRVSARGRDGDDCESYDLVVWSAPPGPPVVHKATDRLGHRLRGEPEPLIVIPPYADHRWVETSSLEMAATITVVTGSSAYDVVRGFRADPTAPVTARVLFERGDVDEWVYLLEEHGIVLAVERDGFQGSLPAILTALSGNGKAASMFWNVNSVTSLSFARAGQLLASFEPGFGDLPDDPEVATALTDLDFTDYRHRIAKGLTAVTRFTGRRPFTPDDLTTLESTALAYPIG